MKTKALLLLNFIFIAILSCGCVNDDEPEEIWSLEVGQKLPQFSVTMSDGSKVTTEDLRGRRSMIVFFFTGCPDCQAELPEIQAVYNAVGCMPSGTDSDRYPIVCISRNEAAQFVSDYWHKHGLTMPYSAQDDDTVYRLFASSVIPRIYISDENLTITDIYVEDKVEALTLISVLRR